MKKYFAATLLLLFVFSVFSQDNLKNKDYYLQKSKNQKTLLDILGKWRGSDHRWWFYSIYKLL